VSVIERIEMIPWFASVGMPLGTFRFRTTNVASWSEAIVSCRSIEWDNFNIDRRNDLTLHLNQECKTEFQKWNEITREVKTQLDQSAWPTMRQFLADNALPDVIAVYSTWDTLSAVMTDKFKSYSPPTFFLDLLPVFEKGHFPCGWQGEWPEGDLVVF
jgi:hypothetical protein